MADTLVTDAVSVPRDPKMGGEDGVKLPQKRKRGRSKSSAAESLTREETETQIGVLRKEIEGLFGYYREVMDLKMDLSVGDCGSVSAAIAVLLEESKLPLSKLVEEVYEKVKGTVNGAVVTPASVKSTVVSVGQRVMYGVPNEEADILEDDTDSCLWCWETRDVKLMPRSVRGTLKIRRTCRKKIQERITAVNAMIDALQKVESSQNCKTNVLKVSEKLGKVLNEADIRLLIDTMMQKNGSDVADKEAKQEEKQLIKQLEKNKREAEKERKRMERELQKEKLQREKQLQEEAERSHKKEESEMKKLLRKQEEAEKDKQLHERELKKKLAIQKQASIMERFLKRSKTDSSCQNIQPLTETKTPDPLVQKSEISVAMDHALSSNDEISTDYIRKLHTSSWHCLGQSIRSNCKTWGQRQKPKIELVKELKLGTCNGLACGDESTMEKQKLVDRCREKAMDGKPSYSLTGCSNVKKFKRRKQLLQFDKSHRPAFYGIWPSKSHIIGPRHPLRQDPDLDYEIDSDEEWEEEDPGESLSDCDKDEEEESVEKGHLKADDEDESEDGFFVPDGYLSDNEGVEVDKMETDCAVGEESSSGCEQDFNPLLRQQKYLHNLTEHALRKNQPLIILNLMHEKVPFLAAEDTNAPKSELTCLRSLSMCLFPGGSAIETSITDSMQDENEKEEASPSSNKESSTPVQASIPDSDLPEIVATIRSCSQSINKVVKCLHDKFPTTPKSQLRNKVREISNFVDNRWQVRKDILNKLGMSISPERSCKRTRTIATFFSKRCLLPPADSGINPNQTSPESRHTKAPAAEKQQCCATNQEESPMTILID